jgi:hypothetical protein
MRLMCAQCQGNGIGDGMRAKFGELMNLCTRCDGHGFITDEPGERPFIAIFPVSERYVVHLEVPRQKGGAVEFGANWSPRIPPERGRKALTPAERAAYERGRNAALRVFMDRMGGGEFTVITQRDLH